MMLRVKQQKNSYSVAFRSKEKLFSKECILGTLFALLIHLTAFSLFTITTSAREHLCPLRALHVEVDMGGAKLAHTQITTPLEVFELPLYSTLNLCLPTQETSLEFDCQEPDFSAIEVIDYESLYIDFDDDQD